MPVLTSKVPAVRFMADEIAKGSQDAGTGAGTPADLTALARDTEAGQPWSRGQQLQTLGMIWVAA